MRIAILAVALSVLVPAAAVAQRPPDPASTIAAQREAMGKLAMMDGVWRGTAWSLTPAGRHDVTHTERIGPFLDGSVKVIEGRSYLADGKVGFNAFGIVSFNPATGSYTLHSYAQGMAGDFPLKLETDGYSWELPAGPGAVIRYRATIGGGAWKEVGYRVAGAGEPVQIFEMNLKRVGDTGWPAAGPVPMK
jgi:hypothetical protein